MQEITQEGYFNRQKSHKGLAQITSRWEDIKDQNLATQLRHVYRLWNKPHQIQNVHSFHLLFFQITLISHQSLLFVFVLCEKLLTSTGCFSALSLSYQQTGMN